MNPETKPEAKYAIGQEVRFGPMIGVVVAILPNGKAGVKWLRTVRGTNLQIGDRQ